MSSTGEAEGSGIIISQDGYILTNNHIVNNTSSSSYYEVGEASNVTVTLYNDETEYEGTIVGTDEQTDLAVIKIDKTGLTAAVLGNSDNVQVGEFAMAVGNPLGMQSSVSSGMISAVNRKVTSDGYTFNLIQTDAAINPGNSGGPLVNINGDVIGINSLKLVEDEVEGMGFAIPIQEALLYIDRLEHGKEIKRPYLGLELINNNPGVKIKNIKIDSIKSDLKLNDIIISIDDVTVKDTVHFRYLLYKYEVGDKIKINYLRDNEEYYTYINLDE